MSDIILQTLQQLVQDVREINVRLSSLEKQVEVKFDSIRQGKPSSNQTEHGDYLLNSIRSLADLSARLDVVESQRR